jgi:hypothetical protein
MIITTKEKKYLGLCIWHDYINNRLNDVYDYDELLVVCDTCNDFSYECKCAKNKFISNLTLDDFIDHKQKLYSQNPIKSVCGCEISLAEVQDDLIRIALDEYKIKHKLIPYDYQFFFCCICPQDTVRQGIEFPYARCCPKCREGICNKCDNLRDQLNWCIEISPEDLILE